MLLAHASVPILSALPSVPPTPSEPYTGASATAAARASLQHVLDNYKAGLLNVPPHTLGASDLSRSDTRSFGETHASELSSIASDPTGSIRSTIPVTPPPAGRPQPVQLHDSSVPQQQNTPPKSDASLGRLASPPINPQVLNSDPAPIPIPGTASISSVSAPDPSLHPTIAETGVPVSAGKNGPGPASGSLHDIKAASPTAGPRSGGLPGNETHDLGFGQAPSGGFGQPSSGGPGAPAKWESAEEEKKRLQREERERILAQPAPAHESAEEEKKRLEREERERVLNAGGSNIARDDSTKKGGPDEDLPPYQDI